MFARYGLTVMVLWLLCASSAGAMTVAVFPVEDLSEGQNGVNFALTEYLSERLEAMGLDATAFVGLAFSIPTISFGRGTSWGSTSFSLGQCVSARKARRLPLGWPFTSYEQTTAGPCGLMRTAYRLRTCDAC
jgi:hypothetical protein